MKNYILLGIAILAGVLAFGISKVKLQSEYDRLRSQYELMEVVCFKDDMLRGDVVEMKNLGKIRILRSTALRDEILESQVNEILGKQLVIDVKKTEPLRWKHFNFVGPRVGSDLARIIPERERAVSIPVDATSSVSGMIEPNDRIDIIGTFRFPAAEGESALDTVTVTLLQNVTVLAVGTKLSTARPGDISANIVMGDRTRAYANLTVSVTPKEAELLVFAQQKGKLTLTLRNGEDVYVEESVQDVNWNVLKANLKEYTRERQRRIENRK